MVSKNWMYGAIVALVAAGLLVYRNYSLMAEVKKLKA